MEKINTTHVPPIVSEFGDMSAYGLMHDIIIKINEIIENYDAMFAQNQKALQDINAYIIEVFKTDEELQTLLLQLIAIYLPKPINFADMDFTGGSYQKLVDELPVMTKQVMGIAKAGNGLDVVNGILVLDETKVTEIIQALIKNVTVTNEMLADDCVTTSKIKNNNVTNEKIASASVTNEKIASASVTDDKIASKSFVKLVNNGLATMNDTQIPCYIPNILLNGDFNINQRGSVLYSTDGYTVDMFKKTGGTVKHTPKTLTTNSYVTLTSTTTLKFAQVVNTLFTNKSYMLSCKLLNDDTIYFMNFTPSASIEKTILSGVKLYYDYSLKEVGVRLDGSQTLNIDFMELIEGTQLYKHVEENTSLSLYRCQEYYQVIWFTTSFYSISNSFGHYFQIPIYRKMNNVTVRVINAGDKTNISDISYSYSDVNQLICMIIATTGNSATRIIYNTIELSNNL